MASGSRGTCTTATPRGAARAATSAHSKGESSTNVKAVASRQRVAARSRTAADLRMSGAARMATTCSSRSSSSSRRSRSTARTSSSTLRETRQSSAPRRCLSTNRRCTARNASLSATPCGPSSPTAPPHSVLSQSRQYTFFLGARHRATSRLMLAAKTLHASGEYGECATWSRNGEWKRRSDPSAHRSSPLSTTTQAPPMARSSAVSAVAASPPSPSAAATEGRPSIDAERQASWGPRKRALACTFARTAAPARFHGLGAAAGEAAVAESERRGPEEPR
mmetsp:Transcript_19863/g.67119  ORF Transcript_19863/g.67119 Transcript_19863/m.67119 type:complete len:279 (+) Transcript_19863:451-1287(+)